MLKSCYACGKIHDSKHICPQQQLSIQARQKKYKTTDKDRFRWTKIWQHKRDDIRDRDLNLCVVCKADGVFEYNDLSVHHIVSLEDNFNLRLTDDNLVTLCGRHHEEAENGKISKDTLYRLIQ